MADPGKDAVGDDVLTAYLDNELEGEQKRAVEAELGGDTALRARLDALAVSNLPYKAAFEPVLAAAPRDRLLAMLTDLTPPVERPAPRRVWIAAAAVILFAAGIGVGVAMRPLAPAVRQVATQAPPTAPTPTQNPGATAAPNWRQVVAEYLELTTPATLAALPDNPALPQAIASYGPTLKLALNSDNLMLPMTSLKDVRLFDYGGKPLVEAAYLSSDAMAVAVCIILNGGPDAPLAFEQREGQNIVFWTMGGHGFMVVGKAPQAQLEALARGLQAKFS